MAKSEYGAYCNGYMLFKDGRQFSPSWDKDGSARAKLTNQRAFYQERARLIDMACARFELNAPPEVFMPQVWRELIYTPIAWSYDEEARAFIALPFAEIDTFDIYGNPGGSIQLHSRYNGYTFLAEPEKFEIMYENLSNAWIGGQIDYYAARISKIDRVIDTVINAQKTPILLSGEKQKLLDMLNIAKKYDEGTPYIYSRERFGDEGAASLEVLNPAGAAGMTFTGDRLEAIRKAIADRAQALCAVEGAAEKRERLNSVEVEKSQGTAMTHGASSLLALQDFCRRFNANQYLSGKLRDRGLPPLEVKVAGAAAYAAERNETAGTAAYAAEHDKIAGEIEANE